MPYANVTFNINLNRLFKANDFVRVEHDASNYITGRVVSYNPSTGVLVVTPYESVGSGSYSSWTVTLTGYNGTSGASSTSGTSGSSGLSSSSGTTGAAGTAGTNGTNGTSGSSGTSGLSGTSASNGTSGSSGTSGTNGI
jgi:hypothetical protein